MSVAARIDTTPLDLATTAAIEAAEMRAWADLYAAAPADWAESVGLDTREVGGALVIRWAATGRRYFSRAIGLGVIEPATEVAIDEIIRGYDQAGIGMFLLAMLRRAMPPSGLRAALLRHDERLLNHWPRLQRYCRYVVVTVRRGEG